MSQRIKTLQERFDSKVRKACDDGCWIWTGACDEKGYGQIGVVIDGKWHTVAAYRVSFELFREPIPKSLCVLHHCDNPPCVNPNHLFLGTKKDNAIDMAQKKRHRAHRGYPQNTQKLTPEDWAAIVAASGRHADIAARFGVTRSRVSQIKREMT